VISEASRNTVPQPASNCRMRSPQRTLMEPKLGREAAIVFNDCMHAGRNQVGASTSGTRSKKWDFQSPSSRDEGVLTLELEAVTAGHWHGRQGG